MYTQTHKQSSFTTIELVEHSEISYNTKMRHKTLKGLQAFQNGQVSELRKENQIQRK